MVDFANLRVGVDTSSARRGKVDLDNFGEAAENAGRKTEQAANRTERAARRSANAATMQTANLAAQFNDIGVMIAAGQSPIQLALQQGTQISQVLNQLGSGTQVFRRLGAAMASIVSPVSLVTIGLTAGVAMLGQWAISSLRASEDTDELTKSIENLKGEAKEAADELAILNQGLRNSDELRVREEILRLRERENELVQRLEASSGNVGRGIRGNLNAVRDNIAELEAQLTATEDVTQAVEDTKGSTNELAEIERLLGEQMQQTARDAATLAFELERAETAARKTLQEWLATRAVVSGTFFMTEDAVMSQDVAAVGTGGIGTGQRPPPLQRRSRRGGASNSAETQRLRDRERILNSIATAQERYNEDLAIANDLLERGMITQDQFNMYLEDLNQQLNTTQLEAFQNGIDDIGQSFADAIIEGENFGESIGRVFQNIARDLLSSGISGLLGNFFGGGLLGGLFAGFFDKGGSIGVGRLGIAGENGPEIIRGPATVTSTQATARALSSSGGGDIELIVRNEPGTIVEIARDTSRAEIRRATPGIQSGAQQQTIRGIQRSKKGINF